MNLATEAGKGTDFTSKKLVLTEINCTKLENGFQAILISQNDHFYGVIH